MVRIAKSIITIMIQVVLAAAVCTRSGKMLFSRQFVPMARSHVEGLVAAFPKLLSTSKQHTYVEASNVRYVYQPLENLYVVVITNKTSNIVEDLDTVHLLAKVIPDVCRVAEEEEVFNKAFELVFAFDEVISNGHRENISLDQIRTSTAMVSNEELIAEALKKTREKKAEEERNKQIRRIDDQKRMMQRMGKTNLPGGMGGDSISAGGISSSPSSRGDEQNYSSSSKQSGFESARAVSAGTKKGMALSKKIQKDDVAVAMKSEGVEQKTVVDKKSDKSASVSAGISLGGGGGGAKEENVHIICTEKIRATLQKEGGIDKMEVKGEMSLKFASSEAATVRVQFRTPDGTPYQFKPHPKVDKDLFAQGIIGLKDAASPFPFGGTPLGVLKWRYDTNDEGALPLTVTCWPSVDSPSSSISVEYEIEKKGMEFSNVSITIPLPTGAAPKVDECEGSYQYNSRANTITWTIPVINHDNKRGTLMFDVNSNADESHYFPVSISYTSSSILCGLLIEGVTDAKTNAAVRYSTESTLCTEEMTIV